MNDLGEIILVNKASLGLLLRMTPNTGGFGNPGGEAMPLGIRDMFSSRTMTGFALDIFQVSDIQRIGWTAWMPESSDMTGETFMIELS